MKLQFFPVMQFIMLYKMITTFEPIDETLKCDHSNESYWELFFSVVYYVLQGGSNFWVGGRDLIVRFKWIFSPFDI